MTAITLNTLTGAVSEYTRHDFQSITPTHGGSATGLLHRGLSHRTLRGRLRTGLRLRGRGLVDSGLQTGKRLGRGLTSRARARRNKGCGMDPEAGRKSMGQKNIGAFRYGDIERCAQQEFRKRKFGRKRTVKE